MTHLTLVQRRCHPYAKILIYTPVITLHICKGVYESYLGGEKAAELRIITVTKPTNYTKEGVIYIEYSSHSVFSTEERSLSLFVTHSSFV